MRGAGHAQDVVQPMYPGRLASLARKLPEAQAEDPLEDLDPLTAQQQLGLAGARDRHACVAESDAGRLA
jgi:hypothetical protein